MFLKKLKLLFLFIIFLAFSFLIYLWYENYKFENSSLDNKIKTKILEKELELKKLSQQKFGITRDIPIIISNKMPAKLYGMATITKEGKISIFLNKKRFKESTVSI